LRHHHALEEVGRLPDHDRVDVVDGETGVVKRAVHRLPAQPGDRHITALGAVPRLPDAEDSCLHPHRASMTHTRFCCRAGPLVACPRARPARPSVTALAAWPIRASPAANIGLAASAPPDGLTSTPPPSPSACRRISSWCPN